MSSSSSPPATRPWLRGVLLILCLALGASGCGTLRFNRAWSSFQAADEQGGMVGRWKGEWKSDSNGHSGGLRCLMTRQEADRYLAWFHSTYATILTFQYETVFLVTSEEAGVLHFEGEQDLGKMAGGMYRYRGRVEQDVFEATFEAENGDHGVFRMRRVDGSQPQ